MNPQDPQYQQPQQAYPPTPPQPLAHPGMQPYPPQNPVTPSTQAYQQLPVAPNQPSVTQATPSANPYDFIVNPDPVKPSAGVGGGSLIKRILVILGLLAVLVIIAAVVVNFIIPKDTSGQSLLTVAQKQQEIARISEQIATQSSSDSLKNLAVNIQLSISSDQQTTVAYVKSKRVQTNDKILALKHDTKVDALLANAKTTNTYDTVAAQTLVAELQAYQTMLKTTFSATSSKKAQAIIQSDYDNAALLSAQAAQTSL